MSDPTWSPRLAGNYQDDDGTVIQSLTIETDTPPNENAAAVMVDDHSAYRPAKLPNRFLSGYRTVSQTLTPELLCPADTSRTGVNVMVTGGSATDAVFIADDPGKLQYFGSSGASIRVPANVAVSLSDFRGPVYFVPQTVAGTVTVSWWSVTE